ncbi:MAG: acetoin utilization deacetylase AcuC-like enzyme [Gammaproteobacteria bacterium]|jgi:acetoin utilization deacetylase AcuC-like enzyme
MTNPLHTGFVYDPYCLAHNPGSGHPERSERLASTIAHLEQQPWFPTLIKTEGRRAPVQWLETIHDPAYIERARAACATGELHLDVPDVGISPESYEVARTAAGAGLALADKLMAGEIDNGFSLTRPPGHHAEHAMALGFCLFNNIAIVARYLQQHHGVEKVAIVDWDVHHGNGTQHTFEPDPSVFFASLHQYPFYPGSGAHSETGEGKGVGATLNCPMHAGSTDADYQSAFTEKVLPALHQFAPDVILISAGFDAHRADPLASIELSTHCYRWMSERILEVADQHASGRVLSFLEGGYSLQALPLCVATHLESLLQVDSEQLTARL